MIRFLEILNSLGINTLEDADNYVESLFSEIDAIRLGRNLSSKTFINFDKTGENEYTGKIPLITYSIRLREYLNSGAELNVSEFDQNSEIRGRTLTSSIIKDFLKFENEAGIIYKIKDKEEDLKRVYSEVLNLVLDCSNKINLLPDKNEKLLAGVAGNYTSLSRSQKEDLAKISKAERFASMFERAEVVESEGFVSFKFYRHEDSYDHELMDTVTNVVYGNTVKLKIVLFLNSPTEQDFIRIKRELNPYNSENILHYDNYEKAISEDPNLSYDLDYTLSKIGFSSLEELNDAMNKFYKFKAPTTSASDPKHRLPPIGSPTNILVRTFGGNPINGALLSPRNNFAYPLDIDNNLYDGLQKIDDLIAVELFGDKFLFEKEGENKEYLVEDIAAISFESKDQNPVPRLSTSRMYEIARSSEKIQEEAVSFAKKYISLFENLFSNRCNKAISEEFPFYKNIFKQSKIISSEIDKLKEFEENDYTYKEDIKAETGKIFALSCLGDKTFEETSIEIKFETDFQKQLTYYIATYKYAKYIASSEDRHRIGLFGLSIGANKSEMNLYPIEHILEGDFYSKIKSEIENHLTNSDLKSFNLNSIIEDSIYENISDQNESFISAISKNLELVLSSIKNEYFISIFNCEHNFDPKLQYSSKDRKFNPDHREFTQDINNSKRVFVDKNIFQKIKFSDNDEAAVGISDEFMIDSSSGISHPIFKNYLDATEESIDKIKIQYIANRKKSFPVMGYKNIMNGVFKTKETNIYNIMNTNKNIDLLINFVNSNDKVENPDYVEAFKSNNEIARKIVSKMINEVKVFSLTMGISLAQYLESKLNFNYMSGNPSEVIVETEEDKDLFKTALDRLSEKVRFSSSELNGIVNLELRDFVYILKDMGADVVGRIKDSGLSVPKLSFDDGKIHLVPQSMIGKIDLIKKMSSSESNSSHINLDISEDSISGDKTLLPIYELDGANFSEIIFSADHSRVEPGNHGKANLKSFLRIYEEIIKDIMIAEEKFIASNKIKTIFEFIKDEKLKNFIDFIFKKTGDSNFNALIMGYERDFPVSSVKVYNYINSILNDTVLSSALLFSKKHKFETKNDFIDIVLSVAKASKITNRGQDIAFSVFCCNLMYESELTLVKKINLAKEIAELFHSDLSSNELDFTASGICNFAMKNEGFIKKEDDQEFSNLLKNLEFMQSKEFIDNSDKAIFVRLVKTFYKIRSSLLFFRAESFKENVISFLKELTSMIKGSMVTDSIIKDSIFFGCTEEDFSKGIAEIKKENPDFNLVVDLINVEKFSNLNTFINMCGYSKDIAYDENEDIYLIIRSADYVCEILTKRSSYMRYYQVAEPKNEKLFEADYSFLYKGIPFGFHVLRDLDPYHFQVGRDTNCCQVLGGVGSAAAVDSFVNSQAGVLVLYSGKFFNKENLLTQSYFHIVSGEDSEGGPSYFILDNVEYSIKNCLKAELELSESHDDFLQMMFAALAKNLEEKGFGETLLGKGYSKISLDKFSKSKLKEDPRVFTTEYTDFDYRDHVNISKYTGKIEGISESSDDLEDISESEYSDLNSDYEDQGDPTFDLSEINTMYMEYHDYSKKKDLLNKIFSELKDKKSERFKALKSFCSKNGLNFQKIKKAKMDFCKKSIRDIDAKEEANKHLSERISYLKRYLKSPAYSSITFDDLAACVDKYNENEENLFYAHKNIKSTDEHIDSRISNSQSDSYDRDSSRFFNELSKYKAQYYTVSKTNILLRYIVLSSKDMIKDKYSELSSEKERIVSMAKKDLEDIGAFSLGEVYFRPYGINTRNQNEDRKYSLMNAFHNAHNDLKASSPNCFKLLESAYLEGIEFLFKNQDVSIEELESELKEIFSKKEDLNRGVDIILAVCFYIFKKYLIENLDSYRLGWLVGKFEDVGRLFEKALHISDIGVEFSNVEKAYRFVVLNDDVDVEELLKKAKRNSNNKEIIKLAKWLASNKFSKEFKKLDELNWEV